MCHNKRNISRFACFSATIAYHHKVRIPACNSYQSPNGFIFAILIVNRALARPGFFNPRRLIT